MLSRVQVTVSGLAILRALYSLLASTACSQETNQYPTQTIIMTVASVLVIQNLAQGYQHWDSKEIKKNLLDKPVKTLLSLPCVGSKIAGVVDKEIQKKLLKLQIEVDQLRAEMKPLYSMPKHGISVEVLRERFSLLQKHHKKGQLSGAVYVPEKLLDHEKNDNEKFKQTDVKNEPPKLFANVSSSHPDLFELRKEIWALTADTNPMHAAWPLINLMEAEVIAWCQQLFHGKSGAPGIITHGGTSSITEACAAYVTHARENPRWKTWALNWVGLRTLTPEIIVPETAHVSFDKAARALGARLVKVPVDSKTGKADVKAMEAAINMNTCLMVASAPSFPFGVMDPVRELAAIAKKHHIPLHVDACLGGFINAFHKSGEQFDFTIPGVTSLSADFHKYGLAPKGSSILLFAPDTKVVPTQVHLDWMGGMYVTPGLIDGSRSGAPIALTWFMLAMLGQDKFYKQARDVLHLREELVKKMKTIQGIQVAYDPEHSIIGVKGNVIDARNNKKINLLLIADQFKKKGWEVNILQNSASKADGFHFCLTSVHTLDENFQQKFLQDLFTSVKFAKDHPNTVCDGMAKIYGQLELGIDLKFSKLPFPECVKQKLGHKYQSILSTISSSVSEKSQDQKLVVANAKQYAPKATN